MARKPKTIEEPNLYPMEVSENTPRFIGEGYKPIDPEARTQQMISLAVDLAEKQLIDGTATSQVITHYLKLAAKQADLDAKIAEQQLLLLQAKTAAVEAENSEKRDYAQVLDAMRQYNGIGEYDIPWPS